MKINSKDFRVRPEEKVKLSERPTKVKPFFKSKKHYHKRLDEGVEELSELQRMHYASSRYALLLIFQAMDAAGKDGAIRHVMSGVNPQGCQVFSFKQPSAEELEHDFLWRTTCRLPERGRIGIFNRSYYEEVLIVRVHPEILRSQGLPAGLIAKQTIWQERIASRCLEAVHPFGQDVGLHRPFPITPAEKPSVSLSMQTIYTIYALPWASPKTNESPALKPIGFAEAMTAAAAFSSAGGENSVCRLKVRRSTVACRRVEATGTAVAWLCRPAS